MNSSEKISKLLEIMSVLRTPVTGCPWDLEQDFDTIAPYTIEEAYEVLDAIERDDMVDLCDELGDLLLQVVFQAQIAREKELFSFDDVVDAICDKMIRRHPHIFGDKSANNPQEVKANWQEIKAQERALKAAAREKTAGVKHVEFEGYLESVPKSLPALTHALKLQQRAGEVGFDWTNPKDVLDKLDEEVAELRAAFEGGKQSEIQDEFGDILFALVNLGRHLNIDSETALHGTNTKFRRRFLGIEQALNDQGSSLQEANLDEMEALWNVQKQREKSNL